MARKPRANSALAQFARRLARHLEDGTRPGTPDGERWTYAAFAAEVDGSGAGDGKAGERSVSNWCKGTVVPNRIEPILDALFGKGDRSEARDRLKELWHAARAAKSAAVLARAKLAPGTAEWVEQDGRLAKRHARQADDLRAARQQQQQQLHEEVRRVAERLAAQAKARTSNSELLMLLTSESGTFAELLAHDAEGIVARLSKLYARSVALAGLLEVDAAVRIDHSDAPLDAGMRMELSTLVRLTAPWLRGHPSIVARDAAAMRELGADPPYVQAMALLNRMRLEGAISADDTSDLLTLLSAGRGRRGTPPSARGRRAGAQGMDETTNLLIAALRRIAARQAGLEALPGETDGLTQRLARVLAEARDQVVAFAGGMQPDLRHATEAVLQEVGAAGGRAVVLRTPDEIAVPHDVEAAAAALIREGKAPPKEWVPHIRELTLHGLAPAHVWLLSGLTALQHLFLSGTQVSAVSPLSGLTALQTLDLSGTQVSDVSPLSGLTALNYLGLSGTQVSDVSPLSGLTALNYLDLSGTQVSDVSPLSGLTALNYLDLPGTQVSNVSPLSGLTALNYLDLSGTQVSDVSPLSGLTALQRLDLSGTQVSAVSPLSGLTALQTLDLSGTQVSDVSPLSGLTALNYLGLSGTQVSDVSPLSGLTALQILNLSGTQVSDVSPLSGLTALNYLGLSGTQVSDVSPLSGLTALQRLYLSGTQVSDVSPLSGLTALRHLDLSDTRVRDTSPVSHVPQVLTGRARDHRRPRPPPRRKVPIPKARKPRL